MRRVALALAGLAAVACTHVHRERGAPAGDGPLVVVYKVAFDDGDGVVRRAKLSVWAEEPDRLHAELIVPVGGVTFIVDAGGGRVCVVDVGAATAYAGADGPAAFASLFGVRVAVADAVAAMLRGTDAAGLTVTRSGGEDGRLPDALRIADGARSVSLTRLRSERGTADAGTLGTGLPPERLRVLPIGDLAAPDAPPPAGAGDTP